MLGDSLGPRDLAVGDVSHEDVPEAVLHLSFHRAPPGRPHQLLARQLVQRLLDLMRVPGSHGGGRTGPEDLSDHRRVLQELLPLEGQRVEPGRDQRLDRLREWHVRVPLEAAALVEELAVTQHADELLRVQRVSARAFQQQLLRLRRQHGLLRAASETSLAVSVSDSGERLIVVVFRSPAAQAACVSYSSGRAVHTMSSGTPCAQSARCSTNVEHRRVGPVDVLDHEHRMDLLRHRLDEPAPGRERLLLRRPSRHPPRPTPGAGTAARAGPPTPVALLPASRSPPPGSPIHRCPHAPSRSRPAPRR